MLFCDRCERRKKKKKRRRSSRMGETKGMFGIVSEGVWGEWSQNISGVVYVCFEEYAAF